MAYPHAQLFLSAFQHSPIGMAIVAMNGQWLKVNAALCRMTGYSEGELLLKNAQMMTHSDDLAQEVEWVRKLTAETIDNYTLEIRYIHKSGHIICTNTSVSLIHDEQQHPLYMMAQIQEIDSYRDSLDVGVISSPVTYKGKPGIQVVYRDISEWKRTQNSLKESNERVTNILESITDAFFAVDSEWTLTYVNSLAASYQKKKPEDLVGKHFWDTFPQLKGSPFEAAYHKALNERVVVEFEDFSPLTHQWYELRAFPSKDGGMAVYYRNITARKEIEEQALYYAQQLEVSRAELQQLIDNIDAGVYSLDPYTNEFRLSNGIEKIFGYPVQAFYDNPLLWTEVIHPDDLHLVSTHGADLLSGQMEVREVRIFHASGETRVIRDRVRPLFDADHHLVKLVGVCVDITKQQRMEESVRESREWFSTTLNCIGDGVITTDTNGSITFMNPVAEKLTAWKQADALGKDIQTILRLIHEGTRAEVVNPILEVMKTKSIVGLANDTWLVNKEGSEIPIDDSAAPILNDKGDMVGIVMVFRDVVERKRYEQQMKTYAFHDALTGLPNRRLFHDRLTKAMDAAQHNEHTLATVFMDLDHFKAINDTFGHEVGDALLQEVARRLTECVREGDTVARLGGDEFILILENIDYTESILLMQKILQKITDKFGINGHEVYTSTSIGISFYPQDGEVPKTLIKHADLAMYAAKTNGKNNYQVYSPCMNEKAARKLEIDNGLREALDKNELELYYQSKVDLVSREFLGVEALIRWNHPLLGTISPAEFIPIAEEIGMIGTIGEWVLETACRQGKAWQMSGYPSIRMAVNVSALQFKQDLMAVIKRVLETTGLEPQFLELEITESVMHSEETIGKLTEIKQMGVYISVDDFGTGYSSLSYLKRLPINALKIDKSFICDIDADQKDADIVKAIISLAKSLNLTIIAEGVETEEQLQFLQQHDCDEVQGYLIDKPAPADQFHLHRRSRRT